LRDNPANNTGQESASNFKFSATPDYYFTSSVFSRIAGLRRDKSARRAATQAFVTSFASKIIDEKEFLKKCE
jgi:hypothetical protein